MAAQPGNSGQRTEHVDQTQDIDEADLGDVEPYKQLIVVSCYTRFDNLAHGPKGTEAKQSLYVYSLDTGDGQMTLLAANEGDTMNPAFLRSHPTKNLLYSCSESVVEDGEISTWSVCPKTGQLKLLANCSAGGTSTCYITLDKTCQNALVVNYWDATIGVFGIDSDDGAVSGLRSMQDPKNGRKMVARSTGHVNHSENDTKAQRERQSDPHSHAVVLDPYFGRIAYVPDLGMDLVRQFLYDPVDGRLSPAGAVHSGPAGSMALGPRYIEFHPFLPVCYVINELSSEVCVFEFDARAAGSLVAGGERAAALGVQTLRLVQTARTIPEGFPKECNTCGRIAVHPSGNFVLVSNRGHDSITVLRVYQDGPHPGFVSVVCIQHTRGSTPRHFQFDTSGQWLVAANQDSDDIVVLRLNLATGKLSWTGHKYNVPSPNFVLSFVPKTGIEQDAILGVAPVARL